MALALGTRLGSYEIVATLGAGGMGDVYRARDWKLHRDVALKVLPDAFANDPERMARFTREAQTLAALNHPNIAHIHGLEDSNEVRAIVMELVEGEDLSQRIARGAIAIDEAQPIAMQVAEALEAAHAQGIIHRDLKPANIKLRHDGTVKVLDFGLARMMESADVTANVSQSPTITTPAMTQAGMVLGTAPYMSPEQAKGRLLDKRSDVWAFGCVFYEMLTAKRAFNGEDVTDTIAAVVRGEPDWSALPRDVPEQIRLLLRRCLEKDRRVRVSDIGVARFLMTETVPATAPLIPATPRPNSRRRLVAGASIGVMVLGLMALAVMAGTRLAPRTVPQSARFVIVPPAAQPLSIQGTSRDIAISPDGKHIVYRVGIGAQQQLVVRALNELDARPLAGITTIVEPFMSPDGRWIGFFAGDELRKVAVTGGPPIFICKITAAPRGASWGPDGNIVFSMADQRTGLLSVSSDGGEPKVLTLTDATKDETGHVFPFVLPGGRGVLFTISSKLGTADSQVAVLDLKTAQRKTLIRGGRDAGYAPDSTGAGQIGHLVYAMTGALRVVRFDLARLEVIGDSLPVVDQVMTGAIGQTNYALSQQGTLIYVAGDAATRSAETRSLVWVNRKGIEEPINAPPGPYAVARLSPDGTRVALDVRDRSSGIRIWDLGRQTLTPLNAAADMVGVDQSPVWTPDGERIIWASSRGGGNPNLWWQAADGTGVPKRLTTNTSSQFPTSMSSIQIAFFGPHPAGMMGPATPLDIGMVSVEESSAPAAKLLLHSTAVKSNPDISPDGHWMAYQSNESGQVQIFVRSFPNMDTARKLVSPGGGTRPAWARDGRELFYLDSDGLLTSVPVKTTASTISVGNPTTILKTRYYAGSTTRNFDLRAYDVSRDGQRFLMIKDPVPTDPKSIAPSASLVIMLNWREALKTLVTTK